MLKVHWPELEYLLDQVLVKQLLKNVSAHKNVFKFSSSTKVSSGEGISSSMKSLSILSSIKYDMKN